MLPFFISSLEKFAKIPSINPHAFLKFVCLLLLFKQANIFRGSYEN